MHDVLIEVTPLSPACSAMASGIDGRVANTAI
jgi:hypothetical protein